MNKKYFFLTIIVILSVSCASSAHYIVGYVNNAKDGTEANGRSVVLWNPVNGKTDNLTDLVGENGNSGYSNYYMIDCEMLSSPCKIGDILSIEVIDDGTAYVSRNIVNVTVSDAGFDFADDLFINSPPKKILLKIDDIFDDPPNEIDLIMGEKTSVWCNLTFLDEDGEDEVIFHKAVFYKEGEILNDNDSGRVHYTNKTCNLNKDFGNDTEIEVSCQFKINYYASPGKWVCNFSLEDFSNKNTSLWENTTINELLAIETQNILAYFNLYPNRISEEKILNISNKGNIEVNISLLGYGNSIGDGYSFVCSSGQNITIENHRYNLTNKNEGQIEISDLFNFYLGLTNETVIKKFGLAPRTDDYQDNSIKPIFWRVYAPPNSGTNCQGNIIIGATKLPEN